MTVAELIEHLRIMPPGLPVYCEDGDGDWWPIRADAVCCMHFDRRGGSQHRGNDFYITIENDFDSLNGVGISV
jgi:hypothetical protein